MPTDSPRDTDRELLGGGDRLALESAAGRDAAEALRALTKASRACLLYDADNDAVARFLSELDVTVRRALRHGPLRLEVRPYELLRDGEVVYREPDRERSFAFRLYRDGIRRLEIDGDVTWGELVRLIGVMSVRFTGVRQREDDAVTLLWAARLEHIRAHTVHGYAETDDPDDGGRPSVRARIADLVDAAAAAEPLPALTAEAAPVYRPLAPAEIAELRAQSDGSQMTAWCVRMAGHLADACGDADDPISPDVCRPAILDLARVLVDEGRDHELAEVGDLLAAHPELLEAMFEPDLLDRISRDVLDGRLSHRALDPVLRHGPARTIHALLRRIDRGWRAVPETLRRPLVQKIVNTCPDEITALAPRMVPELRSDLLTAIGDRDPEAAVPLAIDLVAQKGREIRLAALAVLEKASYSPDIGKALVRLLSDTDDPTTRLRTAVHLARHRERRAYDVLVRAIERGAAGDAGSRELKTLAQAAAIIDPRSALELFRSWVLPKGMLARLRSGASPLWWPAVWGLGRIPGAEADDALKWMRDHTDGEFRSACEQVLATRRRPGDGAGG